MHFEGNQLVVGGLKIHVAILGVIATLGAAYMLMRSNQQGGGAGAYVGPSATDVAIGALQTQVSSLQGSVAALSTPAPVGSVATTPAPVAAAPVPVGGGCIGVDAVVGGRSGTVCVGASPLNQVAPPGGFMVPLR